MKGSIPRKLTRLFLHLATHPRYARRYLAHNGRRPRSPLDLELPWFAYAAIDFLDRFLQPHMLVCEYGSGGSTLFFARRVRQVHAIEDNPAWFGRVCQRLQERQITNARVLLRPFDFTKPVKFDKSAYLHSLPAEPVDVIVIDGSEAWVPVRPICFQLAEQRMRPGGLIVVDDSWRYPELRVENRARRVRTFKSVGPGRPGVTTTDVFCY